MPGHVDGGELAVRAVLGQQVSLAGAATLAGRLVAAYGEPLDRPLGGVTHLFPSADAIAGADPERLAMPRLARAGAARASRGALAGGDLVLDAGADRERGRGSGCSRSPGSARGPRPTWRCAPCATPTRSCPTDLGVRHGLERLGHDGSPAAASRISERWRPYRAYAVQHLWAAA